MEDASEWLIDAGLVDKVAKIEKLDIVPIEVKSEKNDKARSLGIYIDEYKAPFAIKASLKTNDGGDRIFRLPFYLISEMKNLID